MRWIAILTLLAVVSSCTDGNNSHREYIITQAQLEDDDLVNNSTELLE